ncbi:MAG: hypothetical protein JNM18_04745 [Planctomycetaceae bacterium]|nr:hypothetical protein [Planctomycetaceae bacterium]
MDRPILKQQEIPYDHPDSRYMFLPTAEKPFVATRPAIALYQQETILACLRLLRDMADRYQGLDYLQVFEDPDKEEALWFIEDDTGGAITALLPSDY